MIFSLKNSLKLFRVRYFFMVIMLKDTCTGGRLSIGRKHALQTCSTFSVSFASLYISNYIHVHKLL